MMRRIVYLAVMMTVVACGCRREPVWETLEAAEELMEERPDSALTMLSAVDGKRLTGEAQARHALLLSQAYDKNYIDLTNDSLISIAVDFYSRSDDRRHRMLAYYYQSVIYLNGGYYESGLRSALKALDIAKEFNDITYLSRTETIIGRLYNSTYDYKTAYEWELLALEHTKIAGLKQWLSLLYENIGTELYNLQRFREAIEYLDSASMYSETPVLDVLEVQYISYAFLNDFSGADSIYNEIIHAGFLPPIGVIDIVARRHPEDALNLFNEYSQKNNMPLEALDMDYTIAIAYIKKGDIDSAIQSMDRLVTRQNSLYSKMGANILDTVRHEHDIEITHEQAAKARYYRKVSLISLLISFLAITLAILIITQFRNRQKTRRLQLERNLAILESEYKFIKSQLEHSKDKISEKQKRIVSLEEEVYGLYYLRRLSYQTFLNQFSWIEKLGNIYLDAEASKSTTTDRAIKDIKKNLDEVRTKQFIPSLINLINQYRNNLIERISTECPSILKSELDILALLCANFSPRIISFILSIKPQSIYNAKSSIKRKIEKANPALLSEMDDIFA